MKCEHLGRITDLDTRQMALENRVLLQLRKNKQVREIKLLRLVGASRAGGEVFRAAVDRLVQEEIIVRATTPHKNAFLIRLTPRGEQYADSLADEQKWLRGDTE